MKNKVTEIFTDLLNLTIEQNDIIKQNNNTFRDVITELDKQYTGLETKVAGLRDKIMKIRDDIDEIQK